MDHDSRSLRTIISTDPPSCLAEQVRELDQLLAKKSWAEEYPSSDDDTYFSEMDGLNGVDLSLQKELKEAEMTIIARGNKILQSGAAVNINDNRDDDPLEEIEMRNNGPWKREEEIVDLPTETNIFYNKEHYKNESESRDLHVDIVCQEKTLSIDQDRSYYREESLDEYGENAPIEVIYLGLEKGVKAKTSPRPCDESSTIIEESSSSLWEHFSSSGNVFRSTNQLPQEAGSLINGEETRVGQGDCQANSQYAVKDASMQNCSDGKEETQFSGVTTALKQNQKRNWKRPLIIGLLFCLLQVAGHILVLKGIVSYLVDGRSVDFHDNSTMTTFPVSSCISSGVCNNATPVILEELVSYKKVNGTTLGLPNIINHYHHEECGVIVPQGPAMWYTLYGTGNKFTAMVNSTSDNFTAALNIFAGECHLMEQIQGQVYSDNLSKRLQTWDTLEGEKYWVMVFGDERNTTGSFNLKLWDSKYTKTILAENSARNEVRLSTWAQVCSVGVLCMFFAVSVFVERIRH